MSLAAALTAARTSLAANATQSAVVSRNIAGAGEEQFTRKSALRTSFQGGVRIESIGRAASIPLMRAMLGASAEAAGQQAIVDGLEKLQLTVGDPEAGHSPAAMIGALRNAVQQYAAAPDNMLMAQAMLESAKDVALILQSASTTVQQTRAAADAAMVDSVARINELLGKFETLNNDIVRGTRTGGDVTAEMDARDRVMVDLAEEIGLHVVRRPDNDIALYTDSGVTLFETTARAVMLNPTPIFTATTAGHAVLVDGVPVTGSSAAMAIDTGRLAGLTELRDRVSITYQGQLDEIARGLVGSFAESDQGSPPTLPDIPGLFTWPGAPAMPASGVILPGLAATISVNPNADPEQGGSLERLRDGGIGDPIQPAYDYNPANSSAFSARLQELADAFVQPRAFDPVTGLSSSEALTGFASASVGWLAATRQDATEGADYRNALLSRAAMALSNRTGVNIDEEMTVMLQIERSYQASAKLIAAVDSMFAALMAAVR